MQNLRFQSKAADPHAGFQAELQRRVEEFTRRKGIKPGPNFEFWAKSLFWFASTYGSYTLILSGRVEGFGLLFAAFVFGISGLLLGFNIGHDASHGAIARIPRLDHLMHQLSFLTVGIDPTLWRLRHVRSHHVYANVLGSDQDIDKNPFLRMSPEHPWHPRFKHQAVFAPFVYCLALVHSVFWGDWIYLFSRDYAWMRSGISRRKLVTSFLVNKVVHFSIILLIPWLCLDLPFWKIFGSYLLIGALASLMFIMLLVGTHFFDEADFPAAGDDGRLPSNWAVHQLVTSCDWNPESFLASFLSGGANAHAMHHLFPGHSHVHYRKLTPILREVAAEHGVRYHSMSIFTMIRSHFRFLRRMALKPERGPIHGHF